MNFIKVEQCAYTDGAGNVQTMLAYLNLDHVIAVYPDANLVMTTASLNAPRELAYMTLTDDSFEKVLKAITDPDAEAAEDRIKFYKTLTMQEIAELRKEMRDDANGLLQLP